MTAKRLLRLYRIVYQALRLFTGKLKEEIDDMEVELKHESPNAAENISDRSQRD